MWAAACLWAPSSSAGLMTDNTRTTRETRFSHLVELMARLRSPEGCPWDREQDHRSLRQCLLEETYEVLEAIDRDDAEALREELGDLLLQVIFHAQLAAEERRFTIDDVIRGLHEKLVSRHPHVFGDSSAETAAEVLTQWDHLKQEERGRGEGDPFGEVPRSLPALSRAQLVQRRAARAGTGRPLEGTRAAVEAAMERLSGVGEDRRAAEEAVADLLLAAADLARVSGVDAEQALRERVNRLMAEIHERGHGCTKPTTPRNGST